MHEYVVRLRFNKHCLGNVRRSARTVGGGRQQHFLMPRNTEGQVVFLPTWWQAVMTRAADVLCRHQRDSREIRFAMAVGGQPRQIPQWLYRRRTAANKTALHEAYWPGDEISVSCAVPPSICEDDFRSIMVLAGKYFGISPACSNVYGFFDVVDVKRAGA